MPARNPRFIAIFFGLGIAAPEFLAPSRGFGAFCSMAILSSFEDPNTTNFVAAASGDSLPGGKPRFLKGDVLLSRPNTIGAPKFAQIVNVAKLERKASASVRAALKKSGGRALMIPWEYGPDCWPATYSGKTLWIPPWEQ